MSLSEEPVNGWVFVPDLGYYIPRYHLPVVELVKSELADPGYSGRTHGRRATRNAGCTGPLCKKALRDEMREIQKRLYGYKRTRTSRVRELDPLLDLLQEKMVALPAAA